MVKLQPNMIDLADCLWVCWTWVCTHVRGVAGSNPQAVIARGLLWCGVKPFHHAKVGAPTCRKKVQTLGNTVVFPHLQTHNDAYIQSVCLRLFSWLIITDSMALLEEEYTVLLCSVRVCFLLFSGTSLTQMQAVFAFTWRKPWINIP